MSRWVALAATCALITLPGASQQPPQPGQPEGPLYAFGGFRITLEETERIPITSTAFRGTFTLTQVPARAYAVLEVDDQYNLFVNGTLVGSIETYTDGNARGYEVADLLRVGDNVVAVEAHSALDKMSLAVDVRADSGTGPVLCASDESFRAALCPAPPDISWTRPGFDDSRWSPAMVQVPAGALPVIEVPRSAEAFEFPPESYLPSLLPADYPFTGKWIQPMPAPGHGEQGAVWASFECTRDQFDRVVAFVTGDDRYMIYINGHQLGWDWSPVSWNCGEVFDITDDLVDGVNFVTIRLMNDLPPYCAALCEVWGINGGEGFTDGARQCLLATDGGWDSMRGNLYEDPAEVTKPVVLGVPPCEPWFTLKAIPCRLMPTADVET